MKFSVLLPTRNRLEYLKLAVETVRRQGVQDWEIIISDNDSEQPISEYVKSLGDGRIRYYRTTSFVPVTENWNNALDRATGDYVVMLGDDDGLLPGYFDRMLDIIAKYNQPEVIYTGAYHYAYPGVMPGYPAGYLQPQVFFEPEYKAFLLDGVRARKLAQNIMNFRMTIPLNMQYSLLSRGYIERMAYAGSFFQSPYPDFYATTTLLLTTRSLVVLPMPVVIIGITPKSFGYYFFNKRTEEGAKFLANFSERDISGKLKNIVLPGQYNHTCWLLAMETVKNNFGQNTPIRVGYQRYRRAQMGFIYKKYYIDRELSEIDKQKFEKNLTLLERFGPGLVLRITLAGLSNLPRRSHDLVLGFLRSLAAYRTENAAVPETGNFNDIMDVYEFFSHRAGDRE